MENNTKNNTYMKQLFLPLMLVFAGLVLHLANNKIANKQAVIDNQQHQLDSLQTELFNAKNNVGRYEIALELLAQEDEPAAAKFDSLYKHETE